MSEHRYPIRTVAKRTGLSTHVLRSWERRYGAVSPARSAAGDRLYSDDDIERFRLLRRLTQEGRSIGQIANLARPELEDLPASRRSGRADGAALMNQPGPQRYVERSLRALEQMDAATLHTNLMAAALALTSGAFTHSVLLPLLRRTGTLWEEGKISTAHEHLLTVQVSRVLGWLTTSVPPAPNAPNAIAVTLSGERHEFGALIAAMTATEEGWRVTYLGADLPASDVARAAELRDARVVLVSAVAPASATEADRGTSLVAEVRALQDTLREWVKVLIGGPAAGRERAALESTGALWIEDMPQLRLALREISEEGN